MLSAGWQCLQYFTKQRDPMVLHNWEFHINLRNINDVPTTPDHGPKMKYNDPISL